ncbi:hypothetical protein [Bartonella sp. HY038]|uniref:hypothetical protein n=1 Tax=Bartonella sp. HY038 TaxID=2759660 RepID=UPI0015F9D9E1|nr:hypothetical protein [Bartonella sp. HY038]
MTLRNIILLCFFCLFLTGCASTGGAGNSIGASGNNTGSSSPAERYGVIPRQAAGRGRNTKPDNNSKCASHSAGKGKCDFPHWLVTAMVYEASDGTFEGDLSHKGKNGYDSHGSSLKVLEFFRRSNYDLIPRNKTTYNTAWCGAFIQWCLTETINMKTGKPYEGLITPLEYTSISSQAWQNYGKKLDKNKPCLGAIMVLFKPGPTEKENFQHVTFVVGTIKRNNRIFYLGLGGNQGDRVKISTYSSSLVKAFVVPKDYEPCEEQYDLTDTWWVKKHGGKINENESVI